MSHRFSENQSSVDLLDRVGLLDWRVLLLVVCVFAAAGTEQGSVENLSREEVKSVVQAVVGANVLRKAREMELTRLFPLSEGVLPIDRDAGLESDAYWDKVAQCITDDDFEIPKVRPIVREINDARARINEEAPCVMGSVSVSDFLRNAYLRVTSSAAQDHSAFIKATQELLVKIHELSAVSVVQRARFNSAARQVVEGSPLNKLLVALQENGVDRGREISDSLTDLCDEKTRSVAERRFVNNAARSVRKDEKRSTYWHLLRTAAHCSPAYGRLCELLDGADGYIHHLIRGHIPDGLNEHLRNYARHLDIKTSLNLWRTGISRVLNEPGVSQRSLILLAIAALVLPAVKGYISYESKNEYARAEASVVDSEGDTEETVETRDAARVRAVQYERYARIVGYVQKIAFGAALISYRADGKAQGGVLLDERKTEFGDYRHTNYLRALNMFVPAVIAGLSYLTSHVLGKFAASRKTTRLKKVLTAFSHLIGIVGAGYAVTASFGAGLAQRGLSFSDKNAPERFVNPEWLTKVYGYL